MEEDKKTLEKGEEAKIETAPASTPAVPNDETAKIEESAEEPKKDERAPREVFFERIRTNAPDGNFDADEEEYYRKAMSMLDEAEVGSKKYKGLTEKLTRRYQEDPEEVAILMDYLEGTPLLDAIVKYKGEEALTMKEGDEGWDSYKKAVEDRKTERQHQMELMQEVQGNIDGTVAEFNKWAEENGFDDEQKAKVWELIQSDLENISKGKFTKEILGRYKDALNYKKDVEGAREQGKADGRNEVIEAKRKEMRGSGLPRTESSSVQEPEQKKENATAEFLGRMRRM